VTAAIEVRDLVVRFGGVVAVDGVTFAAPAGGVTAVLGPNGAGKTSTIETLEGYRAPTAGSVRVLGLDPVPQHRDLVTRMGVMLQSGGVYRAIRVEEVVRLFAAYYDDPLDAEELVARVGLSHRRRATWRTLSGGEQQRVSLALALVGRPEVLFLDEPSAGLDVSGRRLVHDLVAELRDEGVTVVLATHDLVEAETLADHLVIIDGGHVVGEGTPSELTAAAGPAELRFGAAVGLDVEALAAHLGASVRSASPGEYVVATSGDPHTVARLTAWLADHDLELGDLRAGKQRLEDTFLRLTAETRRAVEGGHAAEPDTRRGRRGQRMRRR
jgi:ABC-2 type transport system ATP-binding protein